MAESTVKEQVKVENKEETKVVEVSSVQAPQPTQVSQVQPSLFVAETDTFQAIVKYYFEGKKIVVKEIDEVFDEKKDNIQTLVCNIKYPSQGDASLVAAQYAKTKSNLRGNEELDIRDFLQLEFIRCLVLMREWDLKEPLNNANIMKLHPKIVKAICQKIREEIDMDGII